MGESGDGVDALAKIKEPHPDLVFLDIKLPGMSALELSRMLQGDESPYIIFTTAYGQYAIDAFKVDACDYLMKPFDEGRFREAVIAIAPPQPWTNSSAWPPRTSGAERVPSPERP